MIISSLKPQSTSKSMKAADEDARSTSGSMRKDTYFEPPSWIHEVLSTLNLLISLDSLEKLRVLDLGRVPLINRPHKKSSNSNQLSYLDPPLGGKKCRTSIRQNFPPDSEKNAGDLKKHPDPRF